MHTFLQIVIVFTPDLTFSTSFSDFEFGYWRQSVDSKTCLVSRLTHLSRDLHDDLYGLGTVQSEQPGSALEWKFCIWFYQKTLTLMYIQIIQNQFPF